MAPSRVPAEGFDEEKVTMRVSTLIGSIGLSCALASSASAQWLDGFDSYSLGPLAAQSLWDEWFSSTNVDANVDSTFAFTPGQSLMIVGTNDVVWDFANSTGGRPTSGKWAASVKTYVPTGTTGASWYILLNEYSNPLQYSVQVKFDATLGKVIDGVNQRGIRYDRWVSLVIAIDLDNDRYDSWYGDLPLAENRSWTAGVGTLQLAVNDCYGDAGGCSGIWYDDDRLDKCAGGPLVLTTKPNPIGPNKLLTFYSQSPLLGTGDLGMLFLWSVNGSLFPLGLVPASYDINGEWTFGATVPTGLAGLEIGFRMFAAPPGGKIMLSNEDLVVMK
jgi:hypothetical protein